MLSYGIASDLVDKYMRMSELTCVESMHKFCRVIIEVFGEVYLREPTMENTQRLLSINKKRGFPHMLWKHRFCALGVEELPFCIVRAVLRTC
jgi:hypothetical protein